MILDNEKIMQMYPRPVQNCAYYLDGQSVGEKIQTIAFLAYFLLSRKDRIALCGFVLDGLLTDENDTND